MTALKGLTAATLCFVSLLLFGGLSHPESLLMSLAETSPFFGLVRGVIIILLVGLLVTHPPRSRSVRVAIGAWGLMLGILALELLLNYRAHLLDVIVLMEVAIICGLEALESRRIAIPVREKPVPARKIRVFSA